ncbi:sigma 54-interacting transcriptional regulator [Pelomonas sp. APW6]|uniref:Sigma 54-interacting transcriptional regulator n=1 Tax=Roseateles subflavus TaxID=3053353 RepID=A0ABT7LJ84_9BURK|nr:sigma 54-interacting transcriptional regulator [Pelomonas sp. APW6]MDL5031601.1 sigma 54-interacting transcriptional regulator [Pelomonas sp. APW6]
MNPPQLPQDADGVLRLAAQSMFEVFAQAVEGMMVVDRQHRIVWISDGYKRFLPALGFGHETEFVGRRVEEVVPNTLMAQVVDQGQPMLVDLLTNKAGTFLVSRLPLRDDRGEVIGAVGMVLLDHPETTLQPLIAKFNRLQQELDDTRRQLAAEQVKNRRPKYSIASFVGSSAPALEIKRQARRAALSDATVLLLGETGTGKELLAHAIHTASPRALKPLVSLNIAAVPETLLEAEFFGVAPGAYTGADRKGREGKFKLADGGTLFLDEIGDMPLPLQSKLLRVLQEQELEPLGSNTVIRVDVRVIAATSRDLPAMVARGEFRADLFYRLNVLPLRVPALRERLDDVEALAEALLEDIVRRAGMASRSLAPDALELLMRQDWPGNIRELRNVLEQACLMGDEMLLQAAQLAPYLKHAASAAPRLGGPAGGDRPTVLPTAEPRPDDPRLLRPLAEQIAELERAALRAALRATGGNKLAAAKLLRMSRASLYDKLPLLDQG